MEEYIKCLECSSNLKRINNTHLIRCCNMSMSEYAIKHNLDMAELVLPSVVSRIIQSRVMRTDSEKEQTKNKILQTTRQNSEDVFGVWDDLSDEEKQVILGTLLGDSYLFRPNKTNNTYLECYHGIEQIQYLYWKAYMLRRFKPKIMQRLVYNKDAQRVVCVQYLRTLSSFIFGDAGVC